VAEEIELKLTAPADALAAVRAHPAVNAIARGRMRTRQLVSTYFDTPERDLAAAGIALRLRRAGTLWLQTVKGEGDAAAGLHRRTEFEWRLAAPKLDTAKLARTPWRKLFARSDGRYRRVFATVVRRSELPLVFADGTRATLCLDHGEIRAGHRRAAVNEIEVELEHGDPSRLFELASTLAVDLPVRVTHTSKAERGYALASDTRPRPRRARPVALAPSATPQAALAAIAAECIGQVEANAEAMLADGHPEYLHQLRVGWRRVRSLLKLAALVASPEAIAPLEE
jgi:triphosphatase